MVDDMPDFIKKADLYVHAAIVSFKLIKTATFIRWWQIAEFVTGPEHMYLMQVSTYVYVRISCHFITELLQIAPGRNVPKVVCEPLQIGSYRPNAADAGRLRICTPYLADSPACSLWYHD
jgi:hypothetical protein